MTQLVPEIYYLLRFDLRNFSFGNIISKLMISCNFDLYCKTIIKFLTQHTLEKHMIISERVFKGNSMNKINLKRIRKTNMEFQRD